jgi:YVTN family beta-propeller protein
VTERPRGTVTFLFTDVEGSTRLVKLLRDRYGSLLAAHQRLLREAFAAHGGEEVDTQGDSFFYVFSRARDAAAAAADGERALAAHEWPEGAEFRVRMGMHTGEPNVTEEGRYHGIGVNRTARIMAAGHGGQVLVSQATASVLADDELEGITLRDLGEHKLKDLDRPERIYQLEIQDLPAEFPPLKTDAPATAADELAAPPTPLYRRPVAIGAFAGVVAAAVAIPVFAFGGGSEGTTLARVDANSVGVVDPSSGAIVADVPDVPTPTRMTSGARAIWVTSSPENNVYRIDPESHELRQTIRVGDGPSGIAVGGGDVWVANALGGTVSRIDADSNEVVGEPIQVGNNPTAVAFGEGSIWVTNVDDQTVSRIDPSTGRVTATIDVGASGRGIAVGSGAVWIGDAAKNRVVRLDPKTSDVTQTIGVGSGPSAVAFGAGSVWVANTLDGTVSRIDPASNAVRATVAVGASPGAIATSAAGVWVANEAERTVVRLEPRTGNVAQTVRTGARPTGLALADELWIAGQAAEGVHRGGRLLVTTPYIGKERDPANSYDAPGWRVLNITNDGLVGFKNVGGGEGAQLVPNLATALPTPTDGGKTYAFRLRRGIRYSNGVRMKASDVRSTFERLYRSRTPTPQYFASLRGGANCVARPKQCNLSSGIVTDDAAGTVTFHLTAPDAEFLYKLATPFGSVLPAGTPVSKGGTRTVPATGPYEIESSSSKRLRLVRNRYFRVWDPVARPAGYPDEIVITVDPRGDRVAMDVGRGRADVATGINFTPRVAQFATQHPAQVHTTPQPTTLYWFLNTRVPPFDDVRARRAVNYAIDRAEFVRVIGGPEAAQPTCQVLPPNFPGYQPYCPYTLSPGGGAWSRPDLAKARELVKETGTAGARVEFWMLTDIPNARAIERFAQKTFTQLGYRFSVKRFAEFGDYYTALGKTKRAQAGDHGWSADYPAASTFFEALTCAAADDADSANASRFCSRSVDREIARARELQQDDQAAAARLWAKIDREVTDQAVRVATVTPRNADLVSKRLGNYQQHPLFGVLLDQLWVR